MTQSHLKYDYVKLYISLVYSKAFAVFMFWCVQKREGLTGAHILWFVHVTTVIAVPTATEGSGLDGGATV